MSNQLRFFCHQCGRAVILTPQNTCPNCNSDFVEIYDSEEHESWDVFADSLNSIQQIVQDLQANPNTQEPRNSRFFAVFEERLRELLNRRRESDDSSIASDRRNYAFGPELDDIITRIIETEGTVSFKPASQEFIDRIEVVKNEKETDCSICLGRIEKGGESVWFRCQHGFHRECAMGWLKVQNTCPNCRCDLEHV